MSFVERLQIEQSWWEGYDLPDGSLCAFLFFWQCDPTEYWDERPAWFVSENGLSPIVMDWVQTCWRHIDIWMQGFCIVSKKGNMYWYTEVTSNMYLRVLNKWKYNFLSCRLKAIWGKKKWFSYNLLSNIVPKETIPSSSLGNRTQQLFIIILIIHLICTALSIQRPQSSTTANTWNRNIKTLQETKSFQR